MLFSLRKLSQQIFSLQLYLNQYKIMIEKPEEAQEIYFSLIKKVGAKGYYQYFLLIPSSIIYLVQGMIYMGLSFFFTEINPNCSKFLIFDNNQCMDLVCSLPSSERTQFYPNPIDTIPYSLGHIYVCEQHYLISLMAQFFIFGFVFFLLVFSMIADNYGRKITWIAANMMIVIGLLMLSFGQQIISISMGLFLFGGGTNSAITIYFYISDEQSEKIIRQNSQIFIQLVFCLGGLVIGWLFYLIPHWREVTIYFMLIPSTIALISIYWVQQNPKFLIKLQTPQKVVQALGKIAKFNGLEKNPITNEDVYQAIQKQKIFIKKHSRIITYYDCFKYKSIRTPLIFTGFVYAFLTLIYSGPQFILNDLGLSPYLSQTFIALSQLISYPFILYFIVRIPRRKAGIIVFSLCAIISLIIILLKADNQCLSCTTQIIQLILIYVQRFISSWYFNIFVVYQFELFPEAARASGSGLAIVIGTVILFINPYLSDLQTKYNISPMLLFGIASVLALLCMIPLQETYNKNLKEEIQQLVIKKGSSYMDNSQTMPILAG